MSFVKPFVLHQQPSLGNGDQGCYAEVSQPHEPQRDRCGRFGQKHRQTGTPAQQKTPQHRVGSPIYSEIREFLESKLCLMARLYREKSCCGDLEAPVSRFCTWFMCVRTTPSGKMWHAVHARALGLDLPQCRLDQCAAPLVHQRSAHALVWSGVRPSLVGLPQSRSRGGGVPDWSYSQFMARCHSSCCSGHHSGIAAVSEVSPQTACDVTFRLCGPLFKPEGQRKDSGHYVQRVMWTAPMWLSHRNGDKTGDRVCHVQGHWGEIDTQIRCSWDL